MLFEKLRDVVYIPTNRYPAVCLAIVFGNIVCGQHFGFSEISVRTREGRTCGFNIKNRFVGLNSRVPVPRTLPRIHHAGLLGNRRDWIRRSFTILVSSGPNLRAGKLRQPHTTCSEQLRDNSQGIFFPGYHSIRYSMILFRNPRYSVS